MILHMNLSFYKMHTNETTKMLPKTCSQINIYQIQTTIYHIIADMKVHMNLSF